MNLLGDLIVLIFGIISLAYLIIALIKEKKGLYFLMIACAVGCHVLGYLYDVCELITTGTLSEGFTIGYLGVIGCYLFLLSANYGCMDGIIDDGTPIMTKSRRIAWIAPVVALLLFVVNFFAEVPFETKRCYFFVWIPAGINLYYHLKHTLVPDMGFGFIKAIRPFNISALIFTILNLIHLTAWNYSEWYLTTVTGILFGISSLVMVVMAKRGVKRWTL